MTADSEISTRVLTVSATYGAGGSVIAPRIAELLGVPFFDRLIHGEETRSVDKIVERLTSEEREQAPPGRLLSGLSNLTSVLGLPVPSTDDRDPRVHLRRQVEASVGRIAAGDGGVILGRAAAVVLAKDPMSFNVRLIGPASRRLAQAMKVEDVSKSEAEARLVDTDRAWARFVTRLFDHDPADPALYHLIIDSTVLPLERTAEIVIAAATAFWETRVNA